MIKLLLFFAFLLALASGFSLVADLPGHVLLQIGETELRASLITGLIALIALVIVLMVLWTILRVVLRLPGLIGLANRMRHQSKGRAAVTRGLVAIGTGDARLAQRYAGEARKLLPNDPLTLLLQAQSAQLSGEGKSADSAFRAMLDNGETRGLGLRGLYIEAERNGDAPAARQIAEEAALRSPDAAWASAALLRSHSITRDWKAAISLIDQRVSRRHIPREEGRRQRAFLLAAAARESLEHNPDEANTLALEALRVSPGLVPAADIAARRATARGDFSKATKILEAAWKENPHPDLADAYLSVRSGDSALDRLKRAKTLQKLMPGSRDSNFAVARAALDAREFRLAREALDQLVLQKASVRACLLMAELEEMEANNQGLVRSWLARASLAPRDPVWVADGIISETWHPVSPASGEIGAFRWIEPPQAAESTLRARIEAEHFESPAPLELVASSTIEPAKATVETRQSDVPVEASSQVTPGNVQTESNLASSPLDGTSQPFIPDDPGPKPQSRFRLFG